MTMEELSYSILVQFTSFLHIAIVCSEYTKVQLRQWSQLTSAGGRCVKIAHIKICQVLFYIYIYI